MALFLESFLQPGDAFLALVVVEVAGRGQVKVLGGLGIKFIFEAAVADVDEIVNFRAERDFFRMVIDDFLASGATILGLVRLAQAAGATIVAIGTLIEKSFEGGREALSYLDVPVESLAVVSSMDGDQINFSDN